MFPRWAGGGRYFHGDKFILENQPAYGFHVRLINCINHSLRDTGCGNNTSPYNSWMVEAAFEASHAISGGSRGSAAGNYCGDNLLGLRINGLDVLVYIFPAIFVTLVIFFFQDSLELFHQACGARVTDMKATLQERRRDGLMGLGEFSGLFQ